MRTRIRLFWAVAILAPAWVTAAAQSSAPQVIGTQQINRFEAIRQLQETVKQNSKSLADWVILGELAHEVAIDLPADQAGRITSCRAKPTRTPWSWPPTTAGCRRPSSSPRTRSKASTASRIALRGDADVSGGPSPRPGRDPVHPLAPRLQGADCPPRGHDGEGEGGRAATGDIGTARPTTVNPTLDNTAATASSTRNDPAIRKSATGGDVVVSPPETASSTTSGPSAELRGPAVLLLPDLSDLRAVAGAPLTYQQFSSSYSPPTTTRARPASPSPCSATTRSRGCRSRATPPVVPPSPARPPRRPAADHHDAPRYDHHARWRDGGTTTTPPATPR